MISHISIKDFAIIKELELDLHPGLNIITGETGAGKSIVIEAVSMALGSRADTDYIRTGADKASITLTADMDVVSVGNLLEEAGVPFEEIVRTLDEYCVKKNTLFTLDNLETLRKNGRLSKLKALAATVLRIKPILMGTPEGEIEQLDQARGANRALLKMVQHVVERTANSNDKILGISFVNCRERAIMVRDAILERMQVKEVVMIETGGLSTVYANDGGIIVVI